MSEPVTINLRFMARDLNLPPEQVQSVVQLLDEGHPVPFIARYRKDQTGNLDEDHLRRIQAELDSLRALAERKQVILRSIESLGKLTPELDRKIREAKSVKRLEDLYLPFKPKKTTLALTARERGLEPLALNILDADELAADLDARAAAFVDPDKKIHSPAEALLGAGHILGELFVERIELRHEVREIMHRSSKLTTARVTKEPKPAGNEATVGKKGKQRKEKPVPAEGEPTAPEPNAAGQSEQAASEQLVAAEQPVVGQSALEPSVTSEPVVAEEQPASVDDPGADTPGSCLETLGSCAAAPASEEGSAKGELPITDSGSGGGEEGVDGPVPENSVQEPPPQEVAVQVVAPQGDAIQVDAASSQEAPSGDSNEPGESGVSDAPRGPEAGEDASVVDAAAEVGKQFQEWREQQKEKGTPVVRSQNQIRKKKAKELKKAREEARRQREEGADKQFRDYHDFSSEVRKLPPHRVLAINRGEKVKAIRIRIENDTDTLNKTAESICVPADHPHATFLAGAAKDALSRLLIPAIERELRHDLSEQAEAQSIRVFAKNLRNLLLQPPLHRKRVLALDPGFKHGCKVVALDEFGNVLAHDTVYPTAGEAKKETARRKLAGLIDKFGIPVIAIGNGTACRETETFISELIASELLAGKDVAYVIVNESGASVYSASPLAKEEFPDYDPLVRGTISIGRRLQDPLNELVKIDPASLGVGMYQHDLKAKPLKDALTETVESCVNFVGVDLNTATPAILRYVAGLNQLTAQRIYDYRRENGPFRSRQDLLRVPGFGQAAFTHAVGFLRIADGENPLDATWIHPESYDLATRMLAKLGYEPADLRDAGKVREIAEKRLHTNIAALAEELGAGVHTVRDVLAQLAKPGRDPRESLPPPVFKKGVLKLDDLTVGMELTGTILNVVDFGAFVDVGLHDSGLIHISHMADRYIRDAHEVVSVGDIVRVWVLEVDKERHRISLTLFAPGSQGAPDRGRAARPDRNEGGDRPPREPRSGDSRAGERREQRPPREGGRDGRPGGQGRRDERGGDRGRRDDRGGRREDRGRDRGPQQPKVYEFKAKEKEIKPLTEDKKSGKEPLRGFGELAQLFGRVQPTPPEEPKKTEKRNDAPDEKSEPRP